MEKGEEKMDYIIVDEYNNWLSTGEGCTQEEIDQYVENVRQREGVRDLYVYSAPKMKLQCI